MITPLVLLSPNGSRDRSGSLAPTVATGITTAPGQYGAAWVASTGTPTITVPQAGHVNPTEGTVLIRARYASPAAINLYSFSVNGTSGLHLGRYSSGAAAIFYGGANILAGAAMLDTWLVLAITYNASGMNLYVNGALAGMKAMSALTLGAAPITLYVHSDPAVQIESAVTYDMSLTTSDVARLSTLTESWTWENLTVLEAAGILASTLNTSAPHVGPIRAGKA